MFYIYSWKLILKVPKTTLVAIANINIGEEAHNEPPPVLMMFALYPFNFL